MKILVKIVLLVVLVFKANFLIAQTFTNVAPSQGINIITNTALVNGAGVSFYDFNNDGWDDLSFVLEGFPHEFYLNNMGVYQPASFSIPNSRQAKQLNWVDYDNDGVLDIFVSKYAAQNQLFKNDGNFNFTDVTVSAGISNDIAFSWGSSFGDYNKDGFLDLYVCKYALGVGDTNNLNNVNNLYRNNGDGTFTDVTFSAGVADGIKASFCAVWFDYNKDTWPDLYVVNDRAPDGTLFRNNGDGTFTDVTVSAHLTAILSNFMSGSVADYDNDNDLDLFVSNTSGTTGQSYAPYDLPMLFNNQGDGTFIDVVDINNLYMENTTWGGVWIDFDNDGWQDLYVATDHKTQSFQSVNSYFFRNRTPNNFELDTSIFLGNQQAQSYAAARGDFNNDGFYDLVVQNEEFTTPFLLENSGNNNNYIKITLEGTVSNRFAIGSWIRVFAGGQQFNQYTACGENYIGQNSQHHIFGVGNDTLVDSVHVVYLSGVIDKYYSLPINQSYNFQEGETVNAFLIENVGPSVLCFGDTTTLQVPLFETYLWNTGDTTREIKVWQAGAYSLIALDSNGLVYNSNMIYIDVLSEVGITLNANEISCADGQDGEVFLEVDNQGRTYAITWLHGATGDSLFNLGAGAYYFNYIDSAGCAYHDSVKLLKPFPLNVQADIQAQTIDSQGSIHILANGGVPPYTILLDNIEIGSSSINMDSGEYVLVIIDSNGCEYEDLLIVPFLTDINVSSRLIGLGGNQISILPNPMQDYFWIFNEQAFQGELGYSMLDISGKVILENKADFLSTVQQDKILVRLPNSLSKGVYFLKINYQSESLFFKLVRD